MKGIGLNIFVEKSKNGLAGNEVEYLFGTQNLFRNTLQRENNELYTLFMESYFHRENIVLHPTYNLQELLSLKCVLAEVVPEMLKDFEHLDKDHRMHIFKNEKEIYCLNKIVTLYRPPRNGFFPSEHIIFSTFLALNLLYENINFCIKNNEVLKFCWDN
jgi:hypothetical protein